MKIALVHDSLVNKGGAEKVFQVFCEIFITANIYTTLYLPQSTYPAFKNKNITTTFLQKILSSEKQLKMLFPLANVLLRMIDIGDVDIVLSSSTFSGKYIKKKNAKHICYCHSPFRLLWMPESYKFNKVSKILLHNWNPLFNLLRKSDYNAAQKVDQFIANSELTKKRILKYYGRDSIVIPPPIDIEKFREGTKTSEYYLVVSRLERYKKVDLVIRVFNQLNLPLLIVGKGMLEHEYRCMAKSNIKFLGDISNSELVRIYQGSIAIIFPQEEDFGLVPLEANACGKPVICYGYGGVETTMIPYDKSNNSSATALFFYEQTEKALTDAIKLFDKFNYDKQILINNAMRFDKPIFKQKILKVIESVL